MTSQAAAKGRGYTVFVRIHFTLPFPLKKGRPMTKTRDRENVPGRTAAMGSIRGLLFGACATVPTGPAVMALPGIGTAGGLLAETGVGATGGEAAGYQAQRRYDNVYEQCMYAKGNQIPGTARR
jgi:hypothetical protein